MKQIKNKMAILSTSAFVLMLPMITHAQSIDALIQKLTRWTSALVPIMMTIAVIAFFYGLVKYLLGDGAEGKGEGLKIMMYGILAVFVMASLGGIVSLLRKTTGVNDGEKLRAPTICSGPNCTR